MERIKERVDLAKEVYSKTGYPIIIDTNFNELGNLSVNEELEITVTVNEFFQYYNDLFYEIPALGDTNSHRYLIETSKEYIGFEDNNKIIESLRKEITQLRRDLLQSQIEKAEALSGTDLGLDINSIDDVEINSDDYRQIVDSVSDVGDSPATNTTNTTIVSSSPANPTSTSTSGGY